MIFKSEENQVESRFYNIDSLNQDFTVLTQIVDTKINVIFNFLEVYHFFYVQ